ncbi:MAG: hypothetical protein R3321_15290, partial [Nitrososphaeraceae archaeon]|nr:hypothetical protein [Nitrososphaeraceae archaeon]
MKLITRHTDLRQTSIFASFMKDLGWKVEKINKYYVYMKKFPLMGFYVKIPRVKKDFPYEKLNDWSKENNAFITKISPFLSNNQIDYLKIYKKIENCNFKLDSEPFNPTKTIIIDLTQKEDDIFNSFKSAKRRAVRRAIKNNIIVRQTD